MSTDSSRPVPSGAPPGLDVPAQRLDLGAVDGGAADADLEAVVLGRVVAAGDLDGAVEIEVEEGEVDHRRRADAEVDDVESRLEQPRWDRSPTNIVSTAIFGDGGAAAVLVGEHHPRAGTGLVRVRDAESLFFPGTTHLMGFDLRNQGLQILLDKGLAPFVRREIVPAVEGFLAPRGLCRADIRRFILHPGGRRVIEVMSERLGLGPEDLAATEAVLSEHGNMSSVTVLFVLDEILRRRRPEPGALGLLGAFGPGFAAELALLEFA